MYSTSEFRRNLKIEMDGEPYVIVECQHVKPGKGVAFVKTRLKNLVSGRVLDRTFRSGETVDVPDLEERNMEFLYEDGENYHFMDKDNYEQISMTPDQLGDDRLFLTENTEVEILLHNGKPLAMELPNFVQIPIAHTEPGIKGDTASGATKPATLASGGVIQVPLFVEEGDVVRIDTRTKAYVERA
ncbi:MAG: elongation factor P [Deltaproteobacteria bacterium]|nr:elongation factor P [Deltaproteobacteria bacterium]